MPATSWKVSLHGGHCGEYCEHAQGTLRGVVEAAVDFGYDVYGISEHAPRYGERFLFPSEKEKGYDVERLERDFDTYAAELLALQEEFAPKLQILRGFEAEVVPADSYPDQMIELRRRYHFEYMVGSVHHVGETCIDSSEGEFKKAVDEQGGLEQLAIRYYERVAEMVSRLKPEVVAHLDLLRLNAPGAEELHTPKVRIRAEKTLDVIRQHQCILDLNTAGYRKGLKAPYPDGWLVRAAAGMNIPFCFGDDSHGPGEVGEGLERASRYLMEHGVYSVTTLINRRGAITRERRMLG